MGVCFLRNSSFCINPYAACSASVRTMLFQLDVNCPPWSCALWPLSDHHRLFRVAHWPLPVSRYPITVSFLLPTVGFGPGADLGSTVGTQVLSVDLGPVNRLSGRMTVSGRVQRPAHRSGSLARRWSVAQRQRLSRLPGESLACHALAPSPTLLG